MAVENIYKSRQRHASNNLWMTALLQYMYDHQGTYPVTTALTNWTRQLETDLKKQDVIKFLKITETPELIGFRDIAYSGANQNLTYDPNGVAKQVEFEIKCLPAQVKNLAIQDGDGDPNRLNQILKLMYLTRKFTGICEGICENERMHKYLTTEEAKLFAVLWTGCTRVRYSTLDTLAPQIEDVPMEGDQLFTWSAKMVKFYKEWGEKAGSPFVTNHRVRDKKSLTLHRDDPVLSAWSGTHKVPVDTQKSVMGMVERVYNLPERCDISGTTTDAVGYGFYGEDLGDLANLDLFVFLNIYGMIISAHHSLFETCSGASLWSAEYYAPFEPLSILNVLGNLHDSNGQPERQDRLLKTLFNTLTGVVTADQDSDIKHTYWYVLNLWRELGGMSLPGQRDKTPSWSQELEITQALYVMAQKLASLASKSQ